MTHNGEDIPLHQSSKTFDRGDSAVADSRAFSASLEAAATCKENSSGLRVSACKAEGGDLSPYQPRPPPQPRRPKAGKSDSAEDTVRTRRLRNSQESLSDPTETGSSSDSLRDDQMAAAPGGPCAGGCAGIRNLQDSNARSLSTFPTGSHVFRDRGSSLSEYERRPHSQQSDGAEPRVRSAKVRLSPVQHTGALPALEMSFASANLRAANRIDRDCLDYAALAREREKLHRNLSDSRLLESMGSDCASVNSMRSTYSVLSPIRPQDVRNRYSWCFRQKTL